MLGPTKDSRPQQIREIDDTTERIDGAKQENAYLKQQISQIQNLGFGSVGVNRGLYKKADNLERELKLELSAERTEAEELQDIFSATINVKHSLLRFFKLVNGVQLTQHAGHSELDRTHQMQGSERERQLLDKITAFQPPGEGSVADLVEGFEYLASKVNKAVSAIMASVADAGAGSVSHGMGSLSSIVAATHIPSRPVPSHPIISDSIQRPSPFLSLRNLKIR